MTTMENAPDAPASSDAMQNVMDEAQQLMEALGVDLNSEMNDETELSNSVLDGFTIDSDDEDVEGAFSMAAVSSSMDKNIREGTFTSIEMNQSPSQPLVSSENPSEVPMSFKENGGIQMPLHPLHEDVLVSSSEATPTNTASVNTTPMSETTSSIQPVPSDTTASSFDFRAKTTLFASNLATFAQKAASQVADQITTHQSSTGATVAPLPLPMADMSMEQTSLTVVEIDNEQKAKLIHQHVGDLLPGERVIMFLSNLLHVSDSSRSQYPSGIMWHCCMTYYRMILFHTGHENENVQAIPPEWNPHCWTLPERPRLLQIPLAGIDKVEKSVYTTATNHTLMGLIIYGKDNGRYIRFTNPSYADTLRAHEALNTYAFPGRRNLGYLFAFESKRNDVMASIKEENGTRTVTLAPTRKRFDAISEFKRQFRELTVWTCWSQLNSQYALCMSYPSILAGPASLQESSPESLRIIRGSAAFRSEQRLPVLTWSCGIDGASLWRASQPKVGLQGNRSTADEVYLKHIAESAMTTNAIREGPAPVQPSKTALQHLTGSADLKDWLLDSNCQLKILDLRPKSSAMANRTGGYGYENTSYYTGTTIQFCNIGNIHAVRDSYQKISALCLNPSATDVQWSQLVEDTKWLSHVRLILAASWEAAYWIHVHRMPVLLHCSHGWDRTGQVAVLAQLLLDPYYRTREGFSALVEKDFMSFGHPFHTRCAHGEGRGERDTPSGNSGDEGQISPIFIQFLDCVYQIVHQYPECFEFNTKYLLVLSEHVYSCRFGTMLCDTEREREVVAGIRQRTHSLWDYVDDRDDLVNKSFRNDGGVLLMPLPTLLRNVTLWADRHNMHGPKPTMRSLPAYLCRPSSVLASDQQSPLHMVDDFYNLALEQAEMQGRERSSNGE